MQNVLNIAESYSDIFDEDKHIINYSRKSFLFKNQQVWIKRKWINRRNQKNREVSIEGKLTVKGIYLLHKIKIYL